jgi:hypothetical protein
LPFLKRHRGGEDTAFVEQILDLPQGQREADIHHHGQADDLGRSLEIADEVRDANRERLRSGRCLLKPISSDTAFLRIGLVIAKKLAPPT